MKMVVSYLNFVCFIEVKAKSKYRILNFVFKFIKKMKWHFGHKDSVISDFNEHPQFELLYYFVTKRSRNNTPYRKFSLNSKHHFKTRKEHV